MAKQKMVVIKEADITNNCPECFNQELKLSFYQKGLIKLYKSLVQNTFEI